jgi:hypothetical protein
MVLNDDMTSHPLATTQHLGIPNLQTADLSVTVLAVCRACTLLTVRNCRRMLGYCILIVCIGPCTPSGQCKYDAVCLVPVTEEEAYLHVSSKVRLLGN